MRVIKFYADKRRFIMIDYEKNILDKKCLKL